jgi:DNA-binding MarR family transcriptional regulator
MKPLLAGLDAGLEIGLAGRRGNLMRNNVTALDATEFCLKGGDDVVEGALADVLTVLNVIVVDHGLPTRILATTNQPAPPHGPEIQGPGGLHSRIYITNRLQFKAAKLPIAPPEPCTCLAIRQAVRHVNQFYDQCLSPSGLRITQYSILAKLKANSPLTINCLAEVLVMDRTTLGRNILPLQRDGLIVAARRSVDHRSKELRLTEVGLERLREAAAYWLKAQAGFGAPSAAAKFQNCGPRCGS